MCCYVIGIIDRAGHVKVYDVILEPWYERAVDVRYYALIWTEAESAAPVTTFTETFWPFITGVYPGQNLLQLKIVVLQPEDFELELVDCVFLLEFDRIDGAFLLKLEGLVFAAKLNQSRIDEHLAHDRKPFNALHRSSTEDAQDYHR